MQFDPTQFRHQYTTRVRFYHVDRQNIVYHLWYLYFLEEGRLEYLREMGFALGDESFISEYRMYIAHNSIDYYASARFDEELVVHSRILSVGNSSLRFAHAITRKADGALLVTGSHVLVHVDASTNLPDRLPENLREMIRRFEGDAVTFHEK
jgi:acyl-CoA thioester hydrolase